jgi:anaerobic selenocysteine-containing dehydrogenase
VVVSDIFLTETAELADVVLPAAGWGEKIGTYTNASRTVHLSEKAVEPPGEARTDLDIFLMYADAMGFKDKDGNPLIAWRTAEEAFAAWRECSRGRPCDYTGLTYDKLRAGTGIPGRATTMRRRAPIGYTPSPSFRPPRSSGETYGHDLLTGASITPVEYRAMAPAGRARLISTEYVPPHEDPNPDFPLLYTTGRTVYQFHTRTKTPRARSLHDAAPDAWVELNPDDAQQHGIQEGDLVRVEFPRGRD